MERIIKIRDVLYEDAEAIAEIYNHYISKTIITFEEKQISGDEIARRIQEVQSLTLPWLVAENNNGIVVGYAYANKWKQREAYRFSVEVTVYINPVHQRQGIGFELYNHLLPGLKSKGIHAAIGGIALPNKASVGLHEKFGFQKAAHLKEVGFKLGQWIDVGYWQLLL